MKPNLLARVFLCFVLLFGGLGINKAHADHISSVDLFVDYIGTGPTDMKYRVTFVLYRICIGNNLALSSTYGTTTVSSANLGFSKVINPVSVLHANAQGNMVMEDTLDNLCPSFSVINSCKVLANTSYSGYTRRVYVDTITVPGRSTDLMFTWDACCRLLTYTNINGAASASFHIEVKINNLLRYNNNSPRYLGQPFTFCCTNQKSLLSNIPSDPDGDSLVTSSIIPQCTSTTNAAYNAGYTFPLPTGTGGSYVVAPISGKATFVATASGKYVLAFRTEDWDKPTAQKLGYASRDITITVLPCTNLPPYIDSIPSNVAGIRRVDTTGGEVVLTACPQAPLSFTVNAHSNNPSGLIFMRPAGTLPPGMTITPTVTGGTGFVTINWTPTAADIGTHVISVLAVDSTCALGQEITLRNEFTFTIDVRPGLDAGPDLLSCPLGDRPVRLGTNANPTSTFTWTDINGSTAQFLTCTDCPNPLASPAYSYTYVVSTDDPRMVCKSEDTLTVFIDTSNSITAPQDVLIVCRPDYRVLQAVTSGPAPLANLPCGTANPIQCLVQDQDTASIGNGNNPAAQPLNTPFYSGKVFQKYQFIVPKRDLLNAGLYSGTINAIAFLHINPTVVGPAPLENVTISLACVPFADFGSSISNSSFVVATTVATLTNYTLTPNDWNQINFVTPYSLDTTTNLLVDICTGPMTVANPLGTDPVAMMPGAAIQKSDNGINVCGGNAPTVQSYNQRPIVRFMYCPSPELPFNFIWQPGSFLSDSNAQNPTAYIPRSINYAVSTIGRNGCLMRDSLHIVVPVHNINAGPKDTAVCLNQPAYLRASGGDAYQWFEVSNGQFSSASGSLSCTACSNPVATPRVTTKYAVVFTNDVDRGNPLNAGSGLGCPDTLFIMVNINPLPPVRSSNRDTMIAYGKSVQLFATGASNYTWTPVGSLTDPNSPAPIATPRETTNYIVTGLDSNGCAYRDTVKVVVNYRDNLLIPSAFTPNGDGRNDVFKIINASFQRLMEFRVFNRWGQEVFTTTDIMNGWDGKWKGVDQDMGNYQYLIRVAYPDGNVETYKGDINLIR